MTVLDGMVFDLVARKNALEYQSPYGYTPSFAPGIAFLVVFAVLMVLHLVLGLKYRYWVVLATLVPGGILEVVGWAGRLWSHYTVLNSNPFIMQICTLILGPAFFSAWAYATLGYCIQQLGPAYSLLKPMMYLGVFVTADIVSLVLQAIGGGQAAVKAKAGENTHTSTQIMLAGILFQLATMTIFVILATDFIIRVTASRPYRLRQRQISRSTTSDNDYSEAPSTPHSTTANPQEQAQQSEKVGQGDKVYLRKASYLLAGVAFASLMIYVRGIYRSIELAQGWSGYLITHEDYFTWLDGFPMVLCMASFAVAHPGWLLPPRRGWKNA